MSKVRMIPILVNEVRMPRADELPDSLVRLVRPRALDLSPARFEFDTSRLLKVLDWILAEVLTARDDAALKVAVREGDKPDHHAGGGETSTARDRTNGHAMAALHGLLPQSPRF